MRRTGDLLLIWQETNGGGGRMEGAVEVATASASGWSWGTFFQIIGGAGLGSAIAQGLIALWRDQRVSRAAASYLAMRIAVTLEAYAVACARLIQDNRDADHRPGEQFPDWETRLPEVGVYPDDADGWRALDAKLADDALSFPAKRQSAIRRINEGIFVDEADTDVYVEAESSRTGAAAWATAKALRRTYGLPSANLGEDPTSSFKDLEPI